MRGRKPKYESRVTEFRQRLIVWKQTQESMRPSLRALARELGTSHQLLSHYLSGLEKWQEKRYWRLASEIRIRANAEGRPLTQWEEQQVKAHERAAMRITLTSIALKQIESIRPTAKRGPLDRNQIKWLTELARPGWPEAEEAKEILKTCRQVTPQEERQARASERAAMFASAALKNIERIKQDAERGQLRCQDIEMLKLFARRRCPGAKELLHKYAQSGHAQVIQ